jgi:hypothetical protein
MRVKLEDEVRKKRPVVVREALWAERCDACQKVFGMGEVCNEQGRAHLRGIFDKVPRIDGRTQGNGFSATVCSLLCAHKLFAEGGWRNMEEYKMYADIDATLLRGEAVITVHMMTEDELRKQWKEGRT